MPGGKDFQIPESPCQRALQIKRGRHEACSSYQQLKAKMFDTISGPSSQAKARFYQEVAGCSRTSGGSALEPSVVLREFSGLDTFFYSYPNT